MVLKGITKGIAEKLWEEPIVANVVIFKKGGKYHVRKYKSDGTLEKMYTADTVDNAFSYVKNLGEKMFVVVHDILYSEVSPTALSDDIIYLFTKEKIIKNAVLFTKTTVTSDYTAKPWEIILVDASSGSITITIPAPVEGAEIIVKKIDNTTNTVTLSPTSGNIDGYDSIVMTTQNEAYHLISDGDNWYIV